MIEVLKVLNFITSLIALYYSLKVFLYFLLQIKLYDNKGIRHTLFVVTLMVGLLLFYSVFTFVYYFGRVFSDSILLMQLASLRTLVMNVCIIIVSILIDKISKNRL